MRVNEPFIVYILYPHVRSPKLPAILELLLKLSDEHVNLHGLREHSQQQVGGGSRSAVPCKLACWAVQ